MAKKFTLFNFSKEGKGVRKEDVPAEMPIGFFDFFKAYASKFWNLTSLNLLFVVSNFPIFFLLFALSGNTSNVVSAPSNELFAPLFGMMNISRNSPVYNALFGMLGISDSILVPSTATYVLYGLSALLIFTFGLSNAGFSYVLRAYVRGEPIFLISDYFSAIKRNFKQAFCMGIIDLIMFALFTYDIMFWGVQGQFISNIFFYLSLFLLLLYIFARYYMYIILITFDLSIKKILKNSFIFSIIGFKRNIVGFLGILGIVCTNYYIFLVFMPLGTLLPFMITLATCGFVSAYCAYPNIKKIMIDPYEKKNPKPQYDSEPIFIDRG